MEGKALNTMLDVDIKKLLASNIAGVMVDHGRSVKQDDITLMAERVLMGLKYKGDLLNATVEMVERVFMRASMGEFQVKGAIESITPSNIVRWIASTYYQYKQDAESIRREQERRDYDAMCRSIGSTKQHPISKAASWLIQHHNDARLVELAEKGLTREMVYELSYAGFKLDDMFRLSHLNAEYKMYYEGLKSEISAQLKAIISKNNKYEMAFVMNDFSELGRGFSIPTSKAEVASLDRRFGYEG